MRSAAAAYLGGLTTLVLLHAGCRPRSEPAPRPDPAAVRTAQADPAPSPKPGERVRQPELDGYCATSQRPDAFYYHGGVPSVRVARKDGCAPLYLTECEAEERCYPPRDQEPGMWCCAPTEAEQATAHATR